METLASHHVDLKTKYFSRRHRMRLKLLRTRLQNSPSFFTSPLILLRTDWLIVWHGPEEVLLALPRFRQSWPASAWNYSRRSFPSSPASRCYEIHKAKA